MTEGETVITEAEAEDRIGGATTALAPTTQGRAAHEEAEAAEEAAERSEAEVMPQPSPSGRGVGVVREPLAPAPTANALQIR